MTQAEHDDGNQAELKHRKQTEVQLLLVSVLIITQLTHKVCSCSVDNVSYCLQIYL